MQPTAKFRSLKLRNSTTGRVCDRLRRTNPAALIDTVIYTRAPVHAADLLAKLQAGDAATAGFLGIPAAMIAAIPPGPLDSQMQAMLAPLLEKAALTAAINDAWLMIAVLTVAALLCVPFARATMAPETQTLAA